MVEARYKGRLIEGSSSFKKKENYFKLNFEMSIFIPLFTS
jgi:hypothetical protein